MPTINEHFKLSLKRTGKEYKELYEWIEGFHSIENPLNCVTEYREFSNRYSPEHGDLIKGNVHTKKEKEDRHDILKIPKFLSFVEDKFGKAGVQEYLYHIKEDYEKSRAYKLAKIILKLRFW